MSIRAKSLKDVGSWLVSPRFREEGPPSYLRVLLSDQNLLQNPATKEAVNQVGYLVLLGYRPATIMALTETFLDNGNRPLYGAELGKILEGKYALKEGLYTKGRYYDDRIGKVASILSKLGVLKEEVVHVPRSQKTTLGYKLAGPYYQALLSKSKRNMLPLIGDLPPDSTTVMKCVKDNFIPGDSFARFCQECGSPLSEACSNCGKVRGSGNLFCTGCGSELSVK